MRGKRKKRFLIANALLLAFTFMLQGLGHLVSDFSKSIAYAASGNTVYFGQTSVEATNANLVYVDLYASGENGDTVKVSYKTYSRTAIRGVDFVEVQNTVTLKINSTYKAKYTIAVKCLNTTTDREKLRVYDSENTYGRYFDLKIVSADNADVIEEKRTCKCYLTYDNKVEATVGIYNQYLYREVAYINDYREMLAKYDEGTGGLDGGSTRKTWNKGVSFDNDTTRRWISTYINPGFASAYGSFVIKNIDDGFWDDDGRISVLAGNREFIENYKREKNRPGMYLYGKVDPPGNKLDGKAMEYMSKWQNPYKKDKKLVDISLYNVGENHETIYWIQEKDVWYASKNSLYDSEFYKIDPYKGILDNGVAAYNHNRECDMEVEDIWVFMTLYDTICPTITSQYCDYNEENGALRIYLRFSEPVYSARKRDLIVKINGYSTDYDGKYIEGNYSDTLVYEVKKDDLPSSKITSVKYELPNDDIGDMSYRLDAYKNVQHNLVQNTTQERTTSVIGDVIDLTTPTLNVDVVSSQYQAKNIYNIVLSANDNGEKAFDSGTVYYSWSTEPTITDKLFPSSYDYSHLLTSEEKGSFNITLAKNESAGITSGLYYLHALAVSKYGFKDAKTFGPYKLDGDSPEINGLSFTKNDLQTKIYNLDVTNKASGTSFKKLVLNATYTPPLGTEKTEKLTLVENGEVPASLSNIVKIIPGYGMTTYQYKSNIDSTLISEIPLDEFILGLMGSENRISLLVSFSIEDAAGNRTTSNSYRVVYDCRDLFDIDIDIPYPKDTSIALSHDVYNIHGADPDTGITFLVEDSAIIGYIADGAKLSILINNTTVVEGVGNSITLKNLPAGYYDFVARVSGTTSGGEVDLISKTTTLSLTDGMNDNTINNEKVNGNLVLTNRVFELEDSRFYYYDNGTNGVANHLYGAVLNESTNRYEGGSNTPTFSSSVEAKKYVKYMEYQDLYLISISETIASLLNSGTGSTVYVKAAGESKVAQAGQLWVRYKKSSWTETTGASAWAFYYYGEGSVEDGVNVNGLSANLNAAIDTVVTRIISAGTDRYLVEEGDVNQNTGAPYLANNQMHVNNETIDKTVNATPFLVPPTYTGDASLYQNKIKIGDEEYPLATNMALTVTEQTQLFYKYIGTDTWIPLEVKDGTLISEAFKDLASGVYSIREYGPRGASEFSFYFDNTHPTLSITKDKDLESESEIHLDGEVLPPITCKSLVLNSMTNEVDPFAYVAIYSYPNRVLQTVLYQKDIANYSLTGGNYYIQVGDRSGNVTVYTILTSDSAIDLSVEENEAKTGVYVKVNNRDDSEIYSYEVYLNETLIDTEYSANKFYRDSGVYRIEVVDIYGNRETRTISHESPSPDITWYYLNDNDGYSVYDPAKPVRMVLEDDPTSPRTTIVYSSTLVRLLFNNNDYSSGDVKFELSGIDSTDYTYNDLTGLLTINSLSSWRLRVWYENQPENDHIYVFHLDNNPPEIGATFVGTTYHAYVEYDEQDNIIYTSSFDSTDYTKYEAGDTITLDGLAYEKDGNATISFENNGVICGSHVVIQVDDPTGIKSFTVTRNGQPQEMELNVDNKLLINQYGRYVLTFTDLLGNTTVFSFINLEDEISHGLVDGNAMEEEVMMYGHDDVVVNTHYAGHNTIVVSGEGFSETYVFENDGTYVRYGQYYVREGGVDEEGEEIIGKYSQFVYDEAFALALDPEVTKVDTWYQAIATDNYTIYVMYASNGDVDYKVECADVPLHFESSFTVGNIHIPCHFIASLSKEDPNITLLSGGEVIVKKADLEFIYIANDLTIQADSVSSNIKTIEYSYSDKPEFETFTTIYKDGAFQQEFVGKEDGFYQIIVTNIYNKQSIYTISKIVSFVSVVDIHTLDGSTVRFYGNEEGKVFCANSSIELSIYSDSVYFIVNNNPTSGYYDKGVTTLELTKEGKYSVRVVGDNGIFEDFAFEIGSNETFLYDESWLTGYNEEALLKDQGYTNQPLTVVLGQDVVFVDMVVNDETHIVLYDNITEEKMIDESLLVDAIGSYGIGKYVVGFRNKYGDLVTKTIYFNNVASLYLDRITTSDTSTYEKYDLEFATEHDFYSNYVLRFSTTSVQYVFTINGEEYRLDEPKTIEFSNVSGIGSFSYEVTYLDEYGNYVSFNAILLRQDLTVDLSMMNTVTYNSALYTRDDICIKFGDGLKATVSIDNQTAIDYTSGTIFYADGEYAFVVRDIAGNRYFYTVNHKSMNHYSLVKSSTEEAIIFGGVVNNGNVTFVPTDGSRIKTVFRDGVLIPGYSSVNFTQTGHWEIVIEDAIGNQSYEEFYILNNDLCEFNYTAPFGYEVTEVWRVKDDGTRELLNYRGPSIKLDENGDYVVVVTNTSTISSFNFTVGIDDTPPTATLNGVKDNDVTANNVTLSGLKIGDVVNVYKDGELISSTTITISSESPIINVGGRYRVTVTNVQGVTVEYNFVRKSIANTAGSIFVMVTAGLLVVGITLGLVYHTKLKTDD